MDRGFQNTGNNARILDRVGVPPVFRMNMERLAEEPLLSPKTEFATAQWTYARKGNDGGPLPQAIAHRGFKVKKPENTMAAFKAAIEVGAHAIETDIHLSKDNVVVLSHDKDLKRCFGDKRNIVACDWNELSQLRTTREPHEPMPRLKDLLEHLAQPGLEDIWVVLDIKIDNDPDDVMRLIASTIESTPPNKKKAWKSRIVLGIWAKKYLELCVKYLPEHPVVHIGFTIPYARQYLKYSNVGFNMLQPVLQGPGGSGLIKEVKRLGRPIYAWTVNRPERMRWCLRKELDGVITDDPERFLEECDKWEKQGRPSSEIYTVRSLLDLVKINIIAFIFSIVFRWVLRKKKLS